ncbi:hypothetical protein [Aquimarina brevivitae]|uniref:hypothetical protein n=1 Tax=Aquimarina brevivitae TaxID=323412 RepID=UPI001F5FD989|nr:hypothetical protein [Aquimarina brevivitae]
MALLVFLEAAFWITLFVILGMLYWVFFRALKLVFSKSPITKARFWTAATYAFGYTTLYLGWLYGLIYLVDWFR